MLQLELDLTEGQLELENTLRSLARDSEDVFQFDFLSQTTIIRKRKNSRTWIKITEGSWDLEDLQALARHGLVRIIEKSAQGWNVSPRPELVGAI